MEMVETMLVPSTTARMLMLLNDAIRNSRYCVNSLLLFEL